MRRAVESAAGRREVRVDMRPRVARSTWHVPERFVDARSQSDIIRRVTDLQIGICEDDAQLRSVLERALRREGVRVRMTASGREAVEVFSATPPDLLVLDVGLPDADGRDVCQALRVNAVNSPVIFLTARGALTDRLSGFHVGADDYITKPFAVAELVARIRVAARRNSAPARPPADGALEV